MKPHNYFRFIPAAIVALYSSGLFAQTLCVKSGAQVTRFPVASIDSVRLGTSSLSVYTNGSEKQDFNVINLTALIIEEKEKGGLINLEAGVIDRSLPLAAVDSITFSEGEVDSTDSDGDKLSNYLETVRYGTNPVNTDTDGDGWSDFYEAGKFEPIDPTFWNPRVCDLPKFDIVLAGAPRILLEYTIGTTTGQERAISTATSASSAATLSQSSSSSYATEYGWSAGASGGVESGFPSFIVTAEANGSYTQENIFSWGSEVTSQNSVSQEQVVSNAFDSSFTCTGALLKLPVKIKNSGTTGLSISSLTMTAYIMDPNDTNLISVIGELARDNESEIDLAPGAGSGLINLTYKSPNPDQLKRLNTSALGMITNVSNFVLVMTDEKNNKVPFSKTGTDVTGLTALVIVDYGPGSGKDANRFNVSTRAKYDLATQSYTQTTLKDVFSYLRLPYVVDTFDGKKGVVSVGGYSAKMAGNGYWYVIITSPATKKVTTYCISDTGYDPSAIGINTRETVEIIYSIDEDKDGVPLRLETLYGISDAKTDSDGDGLTDKEEIAGFTKKNIVYRTDPAKSDTDGDGLNDKDDPDPTHRPVATSADIASVTVMDIRDTATLKWKCDTIPAGGKITSSMTVCNDTAFLRIAASTRVHSLKINGTLVTASPDTSGKVFEHKRVYLPAAGANVFTVVVVSEDLKTTKTYTLTIPSALRPATAPVALMPAVGAYKSLIAQCNTDGDSRITGIVVLRAEHTMPAVTLSATSAPVAGTALQSDPSVVVVKLLGAAGGSTGADDNLKPNTTYYYRFVTFGGSTGNFVYGEGKEASQTTRGKISISATVTVTASNVQDGGSDWDWEMYGNIAFCGTNIWSTIESAYVIANEGVPTSPLGMAVTGTCAPGATNCTVSFYLADYDASSGNDLIGQLAPTVVPYADIIGANTPTAGSYLFTTNKIYTIPAGGDQGTGYVTYTFTCTYID